MRLLILGGTTEAAALARLVSGDAGLLPRLSLAGRTQNPALPPIPCRIGGFGGAAGLAAYLRQEQIDLLIDATHPFANRISAHAAEAAAEAGIPRLVLQRAGWQAQPGDDWRRVTGMAPAAEAIGMNPARVFLTIGRQELAAFRDHAPQHDYVIRSVDPPEAGLLPPKAEVITARGPFDAAAERSLLVAKRIEVLVTKDSGGSDGKLAAARALGLPVIMVQRQAPPAGDRVETPETALDWIASHRADTARGA